MATHSVTSTPGVVLSRRRRRYQVHRYQVQPAKTEALVHLQDGNSTSASI